jgi:hypothetical protein
MKGNKKTQSITFTNMISDIRIIKQYGHFGKPEKEGMAKRENDTHASNPATFCWLGMYN